MASELILVLAAAVCALGVAALVLLAIKYRREEWVFFFWFGMIACGSGAAWCIQEAVKRSDAREQQRPVVPVDARPAK